MSPSSTSQGRRCKKPLTKSSSPRIGFDWSSTQSRRWSGAPDRTESPISSIKQPSTTRASHLTRPKLAGLALFILTTRRARLSDLYDVGIPPSRVIGVARWEIATDVESEPEKWRLHRAMLDAHRPFRKFVYTVGTGSPVYIQTSGKPFYDTNGNFPGYRGRSSDLTAAVRAGQPEEALQEAKVVGDNIAHDLRTPLTRVRIRLECRREHPSTL